MSLTTDLNRFFYKDGTFLTKARLDLIEQLVRYGRSQKYIDRTLKSFDYFCKNPERFDGATIMRDLFDLRYYNPNVRLPIGAMNHDFDWIHGANRNFWKCWVSNWSYFYTDLVLNGKGVHLMRLIGLMIVSLIYVPIMYFKYKK